MLVLVCWPMFTCWNYVSQYWCTGQCWYCASSVLHRTHWSDLITYLNDQWTSRTSCMRCEWSEILYHIYLTCFVSCRSSLLVTFMQFIRIPWKKDGALSLAILRSRKEPAPNHRFGTKLKISILSTDCYTFFLMFVARIWWYIKVNFPASLLTHFNHTTVKKMYNFLNNKKIIFLIYILNTCLHDSVWHKDITPASAQTWIAQSAVQRTNH